MNVIERDPPQLDAAKGNIVIMAGGTGGHIFPGLAVAEDLKQAGYNIYWLGANGLETRLVPQHGLPLHSLSIKGLRGNGIAGWLKAPFILLKAVREAKAFLKEINPVCVVGFGGFAAAPGGIAARLLRIPLVIHEQNAEPGLVNRLLSRLSQRNLSAFNQKLPNALVVGNPIRASLLALPNYRERYQSRGSEPLRILVFGGSQGARILNQLMQQFAEEELSEQFDIWHQTGSAFYEAHKEDDCFNRENYRLTPFIENMDEAYGWADLVICRAGALTVSEILAVHVASCFIPFAKAVDDHQTKNAQAVADIGGAFLYSESEMNVSVLEQLLTSFTREKALEMASKTEILAKPEATKKIVSEIQKVIAS